MHNLTVTQAVRPRMLVRRGQSIMSALQIILNETAKRLLIMIDYKFNLLMEMLVLALIFIGATFFLGNGSFNSRLLPAELLGYLVMFYARSTIMETSADMLAESSAGTLEQMY